MNPSRLLVGDDMMSYLSGIRTPHLILSGTILFFLPFIVTYFLFQHDPGLYEYNLLGVRPVMVIFTGCYTLIGILIATILHKEDSYACALAIAGIMFLGWHLYTIQGFIKEADIPGFDTVAHVQTFTYIAKNGALQPLELRAESIQPPLFYIISALIMKLITWLKFLTRTPFNVISLIYFSLFIVYGIRLAVYLLNNLYLRYITIVGIILWPANLLQCCRISNDIPVYAIMMMFLYFSLRWYQKEDRKDFVYTCLIASLCFLVKMSAVILAALGAFMLLLKGFQRGGVRSLLAMLPPTKTLVLLGSIFVLCATSNTLRVSLYNYTHNKDASLAIGFVKVHMQRDTFINSIFNFNYRDYIYTIPGNNDRYMVYWGERLQSAIYCGLSRYANYIGAKWLSPPINFMFLVTIISCGFVYFYQVVLRQRAIPIASTLLAFQIITFAFQFAMGSYYPHPGLTHARLAYTVVPAYLILYALLAQDAALDNRRLYYFCTGLFTVLIVLTSIFTLLQVFR